MYTTLLSLWIAIDKYLISVVLSSIIQEDMIFLNDESRILALFYPKKDLCANNIIPYVCTTTTKYSVCLSPTSKAIYSHCFNGRY